ncbi:MAG TPA: thioesterase [Micromonosporaceae bacterium]|jgi:predicted thioesterase
MDLSPGLTAAVQLRVTPDDTAVAWRSGDVAVLATPRVVALLEQATVAAVAPALDEDLTTVGTRVEVDHLAATLVEAMVEARATLVGVDGRRLVFEASLHDGATLAARGRIERVVVDRTRFLARAGTRP